MSSPSSLRADLPSEVAPVAVALEHDASAVKGKRTTSAVGSAVRSPCLPTLLVRSGESLVNPAYL